MSMHTKLCSYITKISKGVVHLKKEHCEEIERIVKQPKAYAKVSRWEEQNGLYRHLYTETLNDDEAKRIAEVHGMKKPIEFFAKWEIYDADGVKLIELYNLHSTVNQMLR